MPCGLRKPCGVCVMFHNNCVSSTKTLLSHVAPPQSHSAMIMNSSPSWESTPLSKSMSFCVERVVSLCPLYLIVTGCIVGMGQV